MTQIGFFFLALVSCMEGYSLMGIWLVSGLCECVCPGVCTAVRGLDLDFCLLSEKTFLFKWVFQSVIFCGMRQKTATLILAFPRLLFSFIKASKCPEKENYSMRQRSCSPWLWVSYHVVVGCNSFSTGKKNSQSFYK